jgi:putative flippase GtrA
MAPQQKNRESVTKAIRYFAIALLAYIFDIGGYVLMISIGIKPLFANAAVKILAAVFGFFMHRNFTYKIKDNSKIHIHAYRYFGMAFLYTPLSTFVLYLSLILFHEPIISKISSDIILILITYTITTSFTFK